MTTRPPACVVIASTDFPDIVSLTSPGFCARPPGMFSLEGTTAITLHDGLSRAIARIAPSMAAPPHMSYFIFSMSLAGLVGKAPVLQTDPVATQAKNGETRVKFFRATI